MYIQPIYVLTVLELKHLIDSYFSIETETKRKIKKKIFNLQCKYIIKAFLINRNKSIIKTMLYY